MNTRSSLELRQRHTRSETALDIETEICLMYSGIRPDFPSGVPITVLHIGEEQTAVASGSSIETAAILTLEIGSRKTAVDHFKHDPPTALELENAIQTVEDELARARIMIAPGSTLFTTDAAIHEIALIAGVSDRPNLVLDLDAMERTFDRLAAVTLGMPASQEGIPSSAVFVATLLILREFMHHLRFLSIIVSEAG